MESQEFDHVGDNNIIFQARNIDGYADPIQTTATVPRAGKRPVDKLTGDVNGDDTVNIFDLVIAAGSSVEEMVLGLLKAILPERLPVQTQLLANYPNPFNPETWIPFQLASDSTVTAKIYDVTGKQIRMIQLGHLPTRNYVESNKKLSIGMERVKVVGL